MDAREIVGGGRSPAIGNYILDIGIRAGVEAYERWDYEQEEVAALVAAIYFACEESRTKRILDE